MKLVHFTSLKYPSKKTEPFFHRQMALAFSRALGDRYTFVVRGEVPTDLLPIESVAVHAPRRGKALWYFVVFPYLVFTHGWHKSDTTLFAYDPYLLIAIIFWRSIFRFRYSIAVEWHNMYEDWRDTYFSRSSDFNVVVSKNLMQTLEDRFGVSPKRIVVAYGGVDLNPIRDAAAIPREDLRSKLGLPEGFLVGHVGSFTAAGLSKGIDVLLDALPYMSDDVRIICVGGSPRDIEMYEARARQLGVEKRLVLLGHQPFAKVVEYQRVFDVIAIPVSLRAAYPRTGGLPMKVWECMAAGRPLVYTNLDLLKEALGGRGRTFAPDDPKDFARTIVEMRSEWGEEEILARRNSSAALSYTWDSRAHCIINALVH